MLLHRLASLVVLAPPAALLTACGAERSLTGEEPREPAVAWVQVWPREVTLVYAGEQVQLVARARDADGQEIPGKPMSWAASDTAVATVNSAGLVTARNAGRARITATTEGVSGSATVEVNPGLAFQRCLACHGAAADHASPRFPGTSCPACHLTAFRGWVNHEFVTPAHAIVAGGFELIGIHDTLPCGSCHDLATGTPFARGAAPMDCVACHGADYKARHGGFGFPTRCLTCHQLTTWKGAVFDHARASGGFVLLGAHAGAPCTSCHDPITGVPIFTPGDQSDCIACHEADYRARHAGSGFPTTCLTCHTMTAWTGATFDHDDRFFPIYSGTHANRWASCQTCHPVAANYAEFTCFSCHAHDRSEMDAEHRDRSGYEYDSRACLGCHPRGKS
ncbi:MAG TPA: Ig-like domain-containing protein [Gemmatimonadales bacterium]|nr:Ig-like domain-containing protein [Gemmatimonadales bacterium]